MKYIVSLRDKNTGTRDERVVEADNERDAREEVEAPYVQIVSCRPAINAQRVQVGMASVSQYPVGLAEDASYQQRCEALGYFPA